MEQLKIIPGSGRWRAKVVSPYGVLLRGRLLDVMESLPHVPWPKTSSQDAQAPLGVLMELDRNLHPVSRFAHALLEAQLGPQVLLTGWLSLVSNRSGGVWFDVVADFLEAMVLTLEALDEVRDAPGFDPDSALGRATIAASDRVEKLYRLSPLARAQASQERRGRERGRR